MSSDEMSNGSGDDGSGDDLSASAASLGQSGAGFGGDDDEMFGDVADAEKTHTDYEIVKSSEVMSKPLEAIKEVNELLQVHPTVARQLLQYCQWNQEKLVNRYFAGEKDKLMAEAKVPPKLGEYKKPIKKTTCGICFDEYEPSSMFGMPCNHFFCSDCYCDYITAKVNTDGQATTISCPSRGCNLLVDEVTAMALLPAGPVKDRYLNLVARAFVRDNKYFKGCPAPGCGNFARVSVTTRPMQVQCLCGQEFCSGCSQASHRPCSCDMMAQWQTKIQSDSESENWLKLYTKKCVNAKCSAIISKDGGCQYVRCRSCNTTFCWLCNGQFDHKNHDCNKLELAADASDAAKSLAKWNHFSKRYGAHAQAVSLQSKLALQAKEMMAKLEKDGMTWIEVNFIMDAVNTVIAARAVLRDTYVYGFFLPEFVNRELFEYLQGQLEQKVEELSGLIEKKDPSEVKAQRLKIIDIEKVLKQNLKNVLEGLEKGDVKGGTAESNKKETWEQLKVEYDGWVYNAGH